MDETWDVVVVGGGLAGLAAAATAGGAGRSVLLLDAKPLGGRAATDKVGRFRFNRGAHALYRTTPGRAVLRDLGVQVSAASAPLAGARGRLGDRLGLLPFSTRSLLTTRLMGVREKAAAGRVFRDMPRWKPGELAGLSGAQWFDRLGLTGNARLLLETVARLTTYVVDFDAVSADLVAGQIQSASLGGVDYVHGGWVTLVDGLEQAVRRAGATVEVGAAVRQVVPDGGRVAVHLGERTVLARRVIVAAGTPEAAGALLPERPAAWAGLPPPVRVVCLDVGLGFLPRTPAILLGVDRPLYAIRHTPPTDLAPPGKALVHSMWYLRADDDPSAHDGRAVLGEHLRLAGADPDDAEEVRYLHRMVVCGTLPQPRTGGLARRPGVETGLDGVLVAGDWVGPAGHIADAALASGAAAARAAVEALDREPVRRPVGGSAA